MLEKLQKIPAKRLASASLRNLHPSHLKLLTKDVLNVNRGPRSTKKHLAEVMNWLQNAHAAGGLEGVSGGYSIIDGWLAPYPETTGYLIPTFFDYAGFSGSRHWFDCALRMADWEIKVQMPSGAIQAGLYEETSERVPAVFNTGQVILGWCRAYVETNDARYLEAAKLAGDWLVGIQSADGAWRLESQETETTVHTYDARTAWSLLELWKLTKDDRYQSSAVAKLEWVLEQQRSNGWFENNAFFDSDEKWRSPFTHTIAYVLEGLLESYLILKDTKYLSTAKITCRKLLRIFELRRFLAGDFDKKWRSSDRYTCLTGNAQIAGVWIMLFEITDDVRYLNAALKLNDVTKASQDLTSLHTGIRGGLKGSHPINGKYTPFVFPNWAAKFFADTLMAEEHVMKKFEKRVLEDPRIGSQKSTDLSR